MIDKNVLNTHANLSRPQAASLHAQPTFIHQKRERNFVTRFFDSQRVKEGFYSKSAK